MLTQPTLLLNKAKCLANIERMATKAKKTNVLFRPHFKTHQSAEVGSWFREYEVECITVSSVKMAVYFAENGWKDITIAFPANIREWSTINDLASTINLNIVVESIDTIQSLERNLTNPVGTYIKTDTGYGRTGINAEDYESIQALLKELKTCKNLIFIGFLCHAGHTYNTNSKEEIINIMDSSRQQLLALKTFMANDFPLIQISYGDTPSCSLSDNFEGFDEIRPGNFAFYDAMQAHIGSCNLNDIAVAMACPVVAKHPERGEIVIHGGAVHFSKDQIINDGTPQYGTAHPLNDRNWDTSKQLGYISKLSQEHGIIKMPQEHFSNINIGDMLAILPVHSCLTANLIKKYATTEGEYINMLI
ncbi:alanine racemase [Carboxylicivirga sp. A043]|uniref:alanine racemase n=1 Tax=Carboxylicivirga litoralis TaxID=2816963 RepID=UPI0021CB6187|nr:alanine racemase [Carboxylicivirga sp. A043]MCU4157553.1 alanine racemase [Carboxylicivirga sp. A043]